MMSSAYPGNVLLRLTPSLIEDICRLANTLDVSLEFLAAEAMLDFLARQRIGSPETERLRVRGRCQKITTNNQEKQEL